MERDWTEQDKTEQDARESVETGCWKEILDQAITGMTPVDQAIEHVIDRMERGRP